MKKIVGILGAAAVLATSVFAADFNAGTKIAGNVFSYGIVKDNDGNITDKQINLFKERNDSHDYAFPNFSFSISGDRAGAALKITTNNYSNDQTVKQTSQTIWFKPFDFLKVSVGSYDIALNKETIDWTESFTGLGGEGYLVSVNVDALSVDVGLNEAQDAWWLSSIRDKDAKRTTTIKNFFAKVGYSADFGSIGGYVAFNKDKDVKGAYKKGTHEGIDNDSLYYGIDKSMTGKGLDNFDFGVGYKNTFNPITMFVNVVGHMEGKMEGKEEDDNYNAVFEWIRPELFVSGNVDALGFAAFVAPVFFTNDADEQDRLDAGFRKPTMEVLAKVTYNLGSVTPYVYFKAVDILYSKFDATIKVGATGNLGVMGWNAWVEVAAKENFAISIPFELTVSF